ncbi:MAG TPA: hypothetical protein VHT03_11370 [Rhizomicrobium sp.]|jgi:hypothetical protein|nr:hypothetical protein [Rhizomicrobium sp.]
MDFRPLNADESAIERTVPGTAPFRPPRPLRFVPMIPMLFEKKYGGVE